MRGARTGGGAGGFRDRGALRLWEARFGPNMTPMVDIVLVILIFFMSATAVVGPEWFLRAGLARTGGAGRAAAPDPFSLPEAEFRVELSVAADGRTVATGLGLDAASMDALGGRLRDLAREAGPEAVLVLEPGPRVPYRDVVTAQDVAAEAGLAKVSLAPPR